jgi:hypothetical protein
LEKGLTMLAAASVKKERQNHVMPLLGVRDRRRWPELIAKASMSELALVSLQIVTYRGVRGMEFDRDADSVSASSTFVRPRDSRQGLLVAVGTYAHRGLLSTSLPAARIEKTNARPCQVVFAVGISRKRDLFRSRLSGPVQSEAHERISRLRCPQTSAHAPLWSRDNLPGNVCSLRCVDSWLSLIAKASSFRFPGYLINTWSQQ